MTIESVFTKDNLLKAAKKVRQKKSAGIDGVSSKAATGLIRENYDSIFTTLVNNQYRPDAVLLKEIPKSHGKTRQIAIATTLDRCIQGCLSNALYPMFEEDFSQNSFGFIKKRNCMMAVNHIVAYNRCGYHWISKIDLSGCFDHLKQDRILYALRQRVKDPRIMRLLNCYLKTDYISLTGISKNVVGCPQGSALSPLYANIALGDIDKELENRGYAFCRYADDIIVLSRSEQAANSKITKISKILEKHGQIINHGKVMIRSLDEGYDFLGFHVYENHNIIHIVPAHKNIQKLKMKIQDISYKGSKPEEMITKLNCELRGWLNYYKETEIKRLCLKLDLFIKANLKKAEKRLNTEIDRKRLISCHEYSKKGT